MFQILSNIDVKMFLLNHRSECQVFVEKLRAILKIQPMYSLNFQEQENFLEVECTRGGILRPLIYLI